MISSHVKISYLITFIFCPFNNTKICWAGVWSKHLRIFCGRIQQSSAIFGNLRKCSEIVRKRSSGLRNNFGKSSESNQKSSEIRQKRYVYIIQSILRVSSKIWILSSRGNSYISLVHCAHSWYIVLFIFFFIFFFIDLCNWLQNEHLHYLPYLQ